MSLPNEESTYCTSVDRLNVNEARLNDSYT